MLGCFLAGRLLVASDAPLAPLSSAFYFALLFGFDPTATFIVDKVNRLGAMDDFNNCYLLVATI
jgi:hypothetical protein